MRNYKWRLASLLLLPLSILAPLACESLEGERLLVPGAHLSIFIPANWETQKAQKGDGGVFLEATPRALKTVKLRVLVDDKTRGVLDDMVRRSLADAAQLERDAGLRVRDVTQIPMKRGHIAGMRMVHQLELAKKSGTKGLELKQLTDLVPIDGLSVAILVLGPKDDVDTASGEIDRILSSVRSLTPEPDTPRTYPPDAVTGASQRVTQTMLRASKSP
ncbi:MAG: hypothetical protein IT381_07845 [Deltaproteobacteria bacterium]|nr:hypothetical protein [Deltaproteobacteria bacterium]